MLRDRKPVTWMGAVHSVVGWTIKGCIFSAGVRAATQIAKQTPYTVPYVCVLVCVFVCLCAYIYIYIYICRRIKFYVHESIRVYSSSCWLCFWNRPVCVRSFSTQLAQPKMSARFALLSTHWRSSTRASSSYGRLEVRLKEKKWSATLLGPPVVPFYPFCGEGSPTKIDYRKKGALILTSLPEDLVLFVCLQSFHGMIPYILSRYSNQKAWHFLGFT